MTPGMTFPPTNRNPNPTLTLRDQITTKIWWFLPSPPPFHWILWKSVQ